MKFLSWNIDGTSAVLKKCDFMDCLWMWKADIFALQKTKFRKREVGIKFPGYYDYWSFYENCPTSHQQSDNSQGPFGTFSSNSPHLSSIKVRPRGTTV